MATIALPIRRAASALTVALALAGCSSDEVAGADDFTPESGTVTVDARTAWTYVDLAAEARTVTPADPQSSDEWDIGFYATGVSLNGGAAGPGGVVGYCLCQNAAATDAEVLAMTPESERADFDAVTAAQIPASGWKSDTLIPAISEWYTGSGASAAAATGKAWKVRLQNGTSFAKLRVAAIEGASATTPGQVTIEYAVQPDSASPLGAPVTRVVDVSGGSQRVVLGGADPATPTNWDLHFDGYTIRVNGGVSGAGSAGAALATVPFAEITTASDLRSNIYRSDAFGGVFDGQRWYRYNLTGSNEISPTFDVYLVKRGSEVYKLQIINYYNATGDARFVTARYAKIAD